MRRATLKSLAKINLDLRVLNKRDDGFHELRTVFQTISLADTLAIEVKTAERTQLSIEGNVQIADNLIVKAAQAVLDAARVRAAVHFKLTKQIPMGGGLGGGSSNAAAVLIALPVLLGRQIEVEEIAASLGSDVPFFLDGGTAVAFGRGTEFYGLPDPLEQHLLVAVSGLHVATGPAYAALNRGSDRGLTFMQMSNKIRSFQGFVRALGESRRADLACALSENDFEAVVFRQFPKLKQIRAKLSGLTNPGAARMTGSGSAIFALFESATERERARTALTGNRVFRGCELIDARMVSRRGYQRLWRRQLREHLLPGDKLWPLQSRYER
jgi:4-diphosphocytidyl-2-C-methyl-D-erythritol kinase